MFVDSSLISDNGKIYDEGVDLAIDEALRAYDDGENDERTEDIIGSDMCCGEAENCVNMGSGGNAADNCGANTWSNCDVGEST